MNGLEVVIEGENIGSSVSPMNIFVLVPSNYTLTVRVYFRGPTLGDQPVPETVIRAEA